MTQSGKMVAIFSVAVRRDQNNTDWINVVCWDKQAESAGNYLDKGSKVLIDGRMQTRSFDTDGGKRYVTEVIAQYIEFLDRKKDNANDPSGGSFGGEIQDETIPF